MASYLKYYTTLLDDYAAGGVPDEELFTKEEYDQFYHDAHGTPTTPDGSLDIRAGVDFIWRNPSLPLLIVFVLFVLSLRMGALVSLIVLIISGLMLSTYTGVSILTCAYVIYWYKEINSKLLGLIAVIFSITQIILSGQAGWSGLSLILLICQFIVLGLVVYNVQGRQRAFAVEPF
ncbi:IMV membrane protein [Nile crocodilepox virus]|uniref:IMV membrane protein n=1 Tax=Nile crocodilepox virus (isolate Crocodylus niloticus/Zimbabwe/Ume/2001) TaxID=1289473 RepID=Q070B1_CPRVZ|nr:IMV membrane protein [Nile crocodilepox virus]ABJ09031.1 IMV membrane protein [Nile crocodilepox virus]